jgi:hypothetical protein
MAVIDTVDIIKYNCLQHKTFLRNENYLIRKLIVTDGLKLFFGTTILDQSIELLSYKKQPLTEYTVYQHTKRCEHITPESTWYIYKTDN